MEFIKNIDNKDNINKYKRRKRKKPKKSVFTSVSKDTIIEYINIIQKDGPIYLKHIKELRTIAKKHNFTLIIDLVENKTWANDSVFFIDFSKYIEIIINNSNNLIEAIKNNLPDNYNFYSTNLNLAVSTFLLYLCRFVIDLPLFLDNVENLYDLALGKTDKLGSPVSRTIIRRMVSDFNYLEMTKMTKDKAINDIISNIGNFPVGDKLNKNIPMSIKEEIISGVIGNSIIGKTLTNFLASFKTGTDHSSTTYVTETKNKNLTYGFAGNPIYYIRKIIADLEISGYEKRKLERKKLELKLEYLKQKAAGELDKKKLNIYKKQIEILEEKIAKIELKEKAFLDKLKRRG